MKNVNIRYADAKSIFYGKSKSILFLIVGLFFMLNVSAQTVYHDGGGFALVKKDNTIRINSDHDDTPSTITMFCKRDENGTPKRWTIFNTGDHLHFGTTSAQSLSKTGPGLMTLYWRPEGQGIWIGIPGTFDDYIIKDNYTNHRLNIEGGIHSVGTNRLGNDQNAGFIIGGSNGNKSFIAPYTSSEDKFDNELTYSNSGWVFENSNVKVDQDLTVTGNIISRVGTFPDYVFEEDYSLMPLNELSEFIDKEKHLPNMPTETEIMSGGLNLTQVNVTLVEKVEELTLYIIDLQNQLDLVKKELETKH